MSHLIRPTRRAAAVAAVGGLALALTACGNSTSGGGAGDVAAVVKGLDNPFFQSMEEASTRRRRRHRRHVQAAAPSPTRPASSTSSAEAGQDLGFVVNPIRKPT